MEFHYRRLAQQVQLYKTKTKAYETVSAIFFHSPKYSAACAKGTQGIDVETIHAISLIYQQTHVINLSDTRVHI